MTDHRRAVRYRTTGGRHDRNYDSIDDRTQPEIANDPAYYPEGPPTERKVVEEDFGSPNSPLPELERMAYTAGLWFEGIVKGAILVLPPILVIACAAGITMGLIRVGVRGTERVFAVCRRE